MLRAWPCVKHNLFLNIFCRYSSNKSRIGLPFSDKVLVLKSQYNDPFVNLAYENWMYENLDYEKQDILYFWQNSPCVVIGRHQNPWLECDLQYLKDHGIKLARRFSGGGAVYHDMGNLNITFLTSRSRYKRTHNLECIANALSDKWNLDVSLSPRDDLVVDGVFKVSGSAAKLGKYSSYHHCTLLLDANLSMLNKAITSRTMVEHSRATQSVSSHVINLKDIELSLSVDDVISDVAQMYMKVNQPPNLLDMDIFQKYSSEIDDIKHELKTWDWTFGKTSQFNVKNSLFLASGKKVQTDIEIKSGKIKNIAVSPNLFEEDLNLCLRGVKFESDKISEVIVMHLETNTGFQDQTMANDIKEILTCISKMA